MKTEIDTKGFSLKSFKHAKFASHETTCFEAKVCFKGKVVAHAENDGQGGCTMVHLTEAARSFPELTEMRVLRTVDDIQPSLESIVDKLVHEELVAREDARLRKKVAKDLATTVLFTCKGDREGEFRTLRQKFATAEETKAVAAKLKAAKPEVDKVLNLMPFEEAFSLLVVIKG